MKYRFLPLPFLFCLSLAMSPLSAQENRLQAGIQLGALYENAPRYNEAYQGTGENGLSVDATLGFHLNFFLAKRWSIFSQGDVFRRFIPRQRSFNGDDVQYGIYESGFVRPGFVEGHRWFGQIDLGIQHHFLLGKRKDAPEIRLGIGSRFQGSIYHRFDRYTPNDPEVFVAEEKDWWGNGRFLPIARLGFWLPLNEHWGLIVNNSFQPNYVRRPQLDPWFYSQVGISRRW
ncbi:MAG: hypothetical protein AAFR61_07900 [Bacteroidota bacterium]